MDWALVLASQEVEATIVRSETGAWRLLVPPADQERAWSSIRQYQAENRGWGWRQHFPGSDLLFHWGGFFWCLLLVFTYQLSSLNPLLRSNWAFETRSVAEGEWWRALTATLLHADLAHLLANLTTGLILLGLAMARFGAGQALLATVLAGMAGNFTGYLLYPQPYVGVGASGVVMGALGLISVQAFKDWRDDPHTARFVIKSIMAGVLLFVLLGMNPEADVLAHFGGFAAGILFGVVLSSVTPRAARSQAAIAASWLTLLLLFLCALWLAGRRA